MSDYPLRRLLPQRHRRRTRRQPPERHASTVLVVEDDAEMRRLLALTLRAGGYEVAEAASAEDALAWLGLSFFDSSLERVPALLISDIRLPDFSGLDLISELASSCEFVPSILITGFPDAETVAEAHEFGAARVLAKPFDMKELMGVVRETIRG